MQEFHEKMTRFSFIVSAQSYLVISKSNNNLNIVIRQQEDLTQVTNSKSNLKLSKSDKSWIIQNMRIDH
jgi:hypothetical protein